MLQSTLFLVDSTLGKLAKWLRILGFDTLYRRHWSAHLISVHLTASERIFLTRNIRLFERWKGKYRIVFVSSDILKEQLEEVIKNLQLALDSNALFTRCLDCNSLLIPISQQEVENKVPDYILISQDRFKHCPSCKKIFWPGSHPKRMLAKIDQSGLLN